ncbi:MAG: MutT/nudix family protein [Candidatus Levybacteria bacterium GW2011_GWA2_40_8]|nr:MAG: MutT/nudix family protein [Candidatus Levybacteria bacterium GW2011_GWA2_40_8]
MKFEFSAGGIVYKKENNRLYVLVCQHSQHHGWVFPKGLIGDKEKGESKESTALREVKEETGIEGEIEKAVKSVSYWYVWEGDPSTGSGRGKVKKTVYYFTMKFISGDFDKRDMEMENVEWLPEEEVETRLTYKADKEAWAEARNLIK